MKGFIGEIVQLEMTGKKIVEGTVIEIGSDLMVVSRGVDYLYIPLLHVKNIRVLSHDEVEFGFVEPVGLPGIALEENLSLRKALNNAKGMFLELYVSGDEVLHGYVIGIMNNYFVFYSPVYKTMYITLNHLKWMIPYPSNIRPYGLDKKDFPVQPTNISLARTFEVQIEKLKNELVVFNLGEENHPIGKVKGIVDYMVVVETARKNELYVNLHHIKMAYKI